MIAYVPVNGSDHPVHHGEETNGLLETLFGSARQAHKALKRCQNVGEHTGTGQLTKLLSMTLLRQMTKVNSTERSHNKTWGTVLFLQQKHDGVERVFGARV